MILRVTNDIIKQKQSKHGGSTKLLTDESKRL